MPCTLFTRSLYMGPSSGPKAGVFSVLMPCGSHAAHELFCCVSGAARTVVARSASEESRRTDMVGVSRGKRMIRVGRNGAKAGGSLEKRYTAETYRYPAERTVVSSRGGSIKTSRRAAKEKKGDSNMQRND
jgi:hypothetical protein